MDNLDKLGLIVVMVFITAIWVEFETIQKLFKGKKMLPDNWNEFTADQRNSWLRDALKQDLSITFTKVDGTERTMPCTLRADALPPQTVNENKKTKTVKPETISVWCLDKSEWRSFRVMNVVSVKKLVAF